MKKLVILFSTLFTLSALCLCVGCKQKTPPHVHSYTTNVVEATCTEKGYTEHTCACGDSYKDSYTDVLSHSWGEAEYNNDATCTQNGTETAKCLRKGCPQKNTVEKPNTQLGHDYDSKTYTWNNDKCTAKAVCKNDSTHTQEETVTATYVKDTDATCTANEKGHYLATFKSELFVAQSTQKNMVEKPNTQLGHDYDSKTYAWDNDKCTAKAVCKNDSTHTQEETVAATYVKDTDATCTANEKGHYLATFKSELFVVQSTQKNTVEKPNTKKNHVFESYVSNNDATYLADGTKTANCKFGCGEKDTVKEEGTQKVSKITFNSELTVSGTNVSVKVDCDTAAYSFVGKITVVGNATYAVYSDSGCLTMVDGDVSLNYGANTVYVKQTVESPAKGETLVYAVTITRAKPIYKVSFDTKGGTAVPEQNVELGSLATTPANPTKTGYDFDGWDFDFTTPITANKTVTAKWKLKAGAQLLTVYAQYGAGQFLENIPVKLYKTADKTLIALGSTDKDGKAEIVVESNVKLTDCTVALGEYGVINGKYNEEVSAIPLGFELVTEAVDLKDGATTATLEFNDIRHTYNGSLKIDVPYKRYSENGEIKEDSSNLVLEFDGNLKYQYIVFRAFLDIDGAEQDVVDANEKAANGIYKVSFSTQLSDVKLVYFAGSSIGYVSCDENGIPNILNAISGVAPEGASENVIYSGGDYIMFELNSQASKTPKLLYVYSETAGEVTIKVERLGDARDIVYNSEMVKIADGLEKFGAQQGTLTDMPINGVYKAVFNSNDGYYHVGKSDGPILVVQLNKTNARVADTAITKIPESMAAQLGEGAGQGYFIVKVTSADGYTVNSYNFYNAIMGYTDDGGNKINGYTNFANADGVFPVNEQLKLFLDHKSFKSSHEAKEGFAWLVACMYYAPEGGLDLSGDGTANNPYIVISGENTVKTTADAYLEFSADVDGFYSFKANNGTLSLVTENVVNYTHNGVLYVQCVAGTAYKLKLNASSDCVVNIGTVGELKAESDISTDEDGNVTDNSKGVSANKAITTTQIVNTVFVQDNAVAEDGVYVIFSKVFGSANFKFTLLGDNNCKIKIKYNDQQGFVDYNGEEVTLSRTSKPTLLITTELVDGKVVDGSYLLIVEEIKNS